eukprot:Filipodium_phascolosomae@DN2515_c0_g1_i1.p1
MPAEAEPCAGSNQLPTNQQALRELSVLEERFCGVVDEELTRSDCLRPMKAGRRHYPYIACYPILYKQYKSSADPYIRLQLLRQLHFHSLHSGYKPWLDFQISG